MRLMSDSIPPSDDNWLPIATAPLDGTAVWVKSRNGGGCFQRPTKARYVKNTLVDDPAFSAYWTCQNYADGQPAPMYFPPILWSPVTGD